MSGERSADGTRLHTVWAFEVEEAPLMCAMSAQPVDVALVVSWPAEATLDPEPWRDSTVLCGLGCHPL